MRFICFAASFSAFVTMPALAQDLDAKFLIKREGKIIGYHTVDVTQTQEGARVETDIEMRVKFGPIPLFRYEHQAREEWRAGQLVSLESQTNSDGEESWMRAERREGELMIEGSNYDGPAPSTATPSSYWNKALIDADALINTQDGELIDITVERVGVTRAPNNRYAEQYSVTGTLTLNIWYDGEKWVGSEFVVDGEELSYEYVETDRQYAALEDFLD